MHINRELNMELKKRKIIEDEINRLRPGDQVDFCSGWTVYMDGKPDQFELYDPDILFGPPLIIKDRAQVKDIIIQTWSDRLPG